MIRNHRLLNSFSAVLVAVMLLLPAEYVFGAMCTMDTHDVANAASDTCCPESGESERGNETDAADADTTDADTASGTGHCDMDVSSAHLNCEDCECFFLPFSDSRSSADYGITINQVIPDLSIDSTYPLFTISSTIYREHTDPGPSPSRIPIYLANQVFLN